MLSAQYRKSTMTEIKNIEAKLEKLRSSIYPLEASLEPLKELIRADDECRKDMELPLTEIEDGKNGEG